MLLLTFHLAVAQEILLERFSEQEAESNPEAENAVQELLSNPLEVNRLSRKDLLRLPFLTREQVDAFMTQREKQGRFKTLDEALAILMVSGDTLALCREIFFLTPPKSSMVPKIAARWRVIRPATIEETWLGAPYRSYARAMISSGAASVGMLFERDPGERRLDDHRLLYGRWQNGTVDNGWQFVAGNYQIEWAQGLTFWGPYATTIFADIHAASRREGRGLLPYLSGEENAALRGAAFSWNRPHFSLLTFVSSQRLDAKLSDTVNVANLYQGGYHRTPTELARRKTLGEQLRGVALKTNWRNQLEFGLLACRSRYDKNWIRPDLAPGYFNFTGRTNEILDAYFSWTTPELQTDIEVARSRAGGLAGSVVLSGEVPRLRWTIESHYYARDFHGTHGRGTNSISDSPQNEFGYSLGLSGRLSRGLLLEFFAIQIQDLWRTHNLPLPGSKLTTGMRIDWKIRRDLAMQIRWQQSRDDELTRAHLPSIVPIYGENSIQAYPEIEREIISPQWRQSGRWRIDYQFSSILRLTTRLDLAGRPRIHLTTTVPRTLALALSEEVQWTLRDRLFITARYTLFDAPANTPIYQYEHDLPGMFTSVALRERGRRGYIYLRYLSTFGLALSLKLAGTERESSIFEQIRSCSWGAQVDWRLSLDRL
ncbi:MAG: hypothetical protein ONB44_11990 [candidate division KSB1 bacterium]|nr:hypothetical protein [candidate division KSB1 bacterium]